MLTYLFQVSLCWAVFYLLYAGLLSRTTFFQWNRGYLLSTLVLGALLPLAAWLGPVMEPGHPIGLAQYKLQAIAVPVHELEVLVTPEGNTAARPWMGQALFWAYATGALLVLGKLAVGLGQIWSCYRRGVKKAFPGYTLVEDPKTAAPFSFFRLLFWNPALPFAPEDRERVLQHELAHIRGWHSADILLLGITGAVFWWHPLFYCYDRALRTVHEYLADEAVLAHHPKKAYGHLLLRQAQSGQVLALANHFSHTQLKKRILMMTRKKSPRLQLLNYLLLLPIGAALLLAFTPPSGVDREEGPLPVFSGCGAAAPEAQQACSQKKMMEFIQQHLQYPEAAKKGGHEGKVIVQFTVNKAGQAEGIKVVKSAGYGMDEAAVAVVGQMPSWQPATAADGSPIAAQMTIPFSFRLAPAASSEEVFKVVEEMPVLSSCREQESQQAQLNCSYESLAAFVSSNLQYPEIDAEGTVVIGMVVSTTGEIESIGIKRGVHPALDQEALRVGKLIQAETSWIPGRQRGRTVKVDLILPIRFKGTAEGAATDMPVPALGGVQKPRLAGCESLADAQARQACADRKLLELVYQQVKYPKPAIEDGAQGTTVLKLSIGLDGKISAYELARGIHPAIDEAVLQVGKILQEETTWIPGQQGGKAVAANLMLPVKFKLPEEGQAAEEAGLEAPQPIKIQGFSASPNPAQEEVRVKFQAKEGPLAIRLMDAVGKVLYEAGYPGFDGIFDQVLDLRGLPRGILFLHISQDEGQSVQQIVVQ
ncbi:TonB family protein [Phaeodactylibacter luteus]|uniref:TonB family protein n=1 Tax=Phaeodactylibacter luteus TaxID=1564516 RepID=A0A5C6RW03_9BACT|nr:TonB family protein [Phaeodactylibacter luteus]TXB66287.1 TonB family protein [Phaeodactylibacter luteus]